MAKLPGKTCRVQGCPGIASIKNKGYCEKHKHKEWGKYQRKFDGQKRIYQKPIWRKIREQVINRAGGLCEEDYKKGIYVIGTIVDHIIPLAHGGHETELSNLQLLCEKCHKAKSAKE